MEPHIWTPYASAYLDCWITVATTWNTTICILQSATSKIGWRNEERIGRIQFSPFLLSANRETWSKVKIKVI